eukprot:GHVR01157482.1.p1 GENE.GHVR01157482.1~~GHVR01157482.1.p1  ORF type:complete len:108 (+),score=5.66 GHVR01157482.1:5985-6308(+)
MVLYENIIQKNVFYVDAYIRLAYAKFIKGKYNDSLETIDDAYKKFEESNSKILRSDKLLNLKAHILCKLGNNGESKETLKKLGKEKDIYTQIYELSLGYDTIMRKQV